MPTRGGAAGKATSRELQGRANCLTYTETLPLGRECAPIDAGSDRQAREGERKCIEYVRTHHEAVRTDHEAVRTEREAVHTDVGGDRQELRNVP